MFVLLNDRSRMKGDFHVRFCEKLKVKVLWFTRLRGGIEGKRNGLYLSTVGFIIKIMLMEIAEAVGARYEQAFVFPDGEKILLDSKK